jgi:hypothetical protein
MALTRASAAVVKTEELVNNRNRIINGDMRIDQRNAGASISLSSTVVYAVDRFNAQTNVGSGHTIEQVQDAPAGFTDSYKLTVGTGATPTGTNFGRLRQFVEGYNTADFDFGTANAKTITLSFWVKTSVTGNFGVAFFNSANDRSYTAQYTVSSANTWEYKNITIAGDTTGTWLTTNAAGVSVAWDLGEGPDRSKAIGWGATVGSGLGLTGGTKILATTGATFFITGVQLEVGSVATPFERRPFGTELALCQRYYWKFQANQEDTDFGLGHNETASVTRGPLFFPVTMRVAPSTMDTTGTAADYRIRRAGATVNCSSVPTIGLSSPVNCEISFTVASGLTTNSVSVLRASNATAFLGFNSEL